MALSAENPSQLTEIPDQTPVNPATGKPAGRPQAVILLLSSCLSVLGSVLLAPVLPTIQHYFAGTPGVATLTPTVLTVPALMIGLTATITGRIVDRLGRKRLHHQHVEPAAHSEPQYMRRRPPQLISVRPGGLRSSAYGDPS